MKLSLCIIVKNEEINLPKCLGSVKNVVDEIVVLDTGSTDKTLQIAQQFGAKVHYFEWCNNFSIARNEALKYVTGDWVLVLDADETLKPEIVPYLKEAINIQDYLLINLVRQEVGANQSPYSLVSRLFRNHPKIKFDRPYHALVDDSIAEILKQEPYWQIGYLPEVAILHAGYQKAVINQQNKYAKAIAAMEEFFAVNPHDAYVCSKLGALYVEIGKINEGLELLNQGLNQLISNQLIQPNNRSDKNKTRLRGFQNSQSRKVGNYLAQDIKETNYDILYELNYHLGIAHTHLKNLPQAISHYQAAVKLPIYPLLKLGGYNNLGNLLKTAGDLQGAKNAYETAIKIDPSFVIGYYNLGMVCKAMGLLVEAIDNYDKAIQLNPDYAEAYQNLGVVLLKVGDVENSLAAFEFAIALHEQNNPQEAHRLRQGLQEMGIIRKEGNRE
ncbi:tetratricopeptide repeat protein [Sphaerospermopsis aphanizomenoides BCCUSP55]|uniref:glycosyltransferase family 2 protein n=1 Tax=Sphaerospermopsis aphanizomenoides TaxID=459663 RepID=UPI001905F4E3|nr:glycosyltransferase family 2 protein [Sphaerospermopsis aphanizomenoides]MBK1986879.1 tetratricopeptide repeat protein [Sphaerospermopsis aphanizomenoides BCCUSP55]